MKWEHCSDLFKKAFFISFFTIVCVGIKAQDLFDYQHSKEYANFLYQDGQYQLAEKEYMRVVFFKKDDTLSWEKMLRSAQYQHQFEVSLKYVNLYQARVGEIPSLLRIAQVYSLIHLNDFPQLSTVLWQAKGTLSPYEIVYFQSVAYVMQNQWEQINMTSETNHAGIHFVREAKNAYVATTKKSPFLAGAMSTVIPGLGKVYTNRWKDGVFSFVLFAASAWQSYRGFDKYGVNSVFGWTFGAFAAGVYAGNIYGSVKSAHTYNDKIYHDHAEMVSKHLDGYYHWK